MHSHVLYVYSLPTSIKFYDELSGGVGESSVDEPPQGETEASRPAAVATKILELSHISVEVGGSGEGKSYMKATFYMYMLVLSYLASCEYNTLYLLFRPHVSVYMENL